jgi:hypothetical protein
VRSVSQRLEGIEDALDRIDERMDRIGGADGAPESARLERMESQLDELNRRVEALREQLSGGSTPVPSSQERLRVGDPER